MAMKIRLARGGSKKRPHYSIVAADSRAARDGRFLEKLGTYDPLLPKDNEDRVKIDVERVQYWLGQGAQTTDRVAALPRGRRRRREEDPRQPEGRPARQGRRRARQGPRRQGRGSRRDRRGVSPCPAPGSRSISADHAAAGGPRDGFFACSHGRRRARRRARRAATASPTTRRASGRARVRRCRPSSRSAASSTTSRNAADDRAVSRPRSAAPPTSAVGRAPVRPLLPALGFLRAKGSHWGMAFRRGLFAIGPGRSRRHRGGAPRGAPWLTPPASPASAPSPAASACRARCG